MSKLLKGYWGRGTRHRTPLRTPYSLRTVPPRFPYSFCPISVPFNDGTGLDVDYNEDNDQDERSMHFFVGIATARVHGLEGVKL